MIVETHDKFEYQYVKLSTSLEYSINKLNAEGINGWEVIKLFEPTIVGDIFRALMKRKLTRTEV